MRRTLLALAAAALTGLAACETATPYQPLNPKDAAAGGYSDLRLDSDHWRVSFAGNSLTSRETVERYLLYRAAELTVSQGFDWFAMAHRSTDKQSEVFVDPVYGYGWQPYWRFYGPRGWGGWGYWGGPWPGPWGGPVDVEQYNRYEVSAEIVMGRGPRPSDGRALDARQVMTNIGPHLVRPKA